MADGAEVPIQVWVVLGVLGTGPLVAAYLSMLRDALSAELFLSSAGRLLRAGQVERFTKLLDVLSAARAPSPALQLLRRAWELRFEVLDQPPPSVARGYRMPLGEAASSYEDRMRARLAGDAASAKRRVTQRALLAGSGFAGPVAVPLLHATHLPGAWVAATLMALLAFGVLFQVRSNRRAVDVVMQVAPPLFDPSAVPAPS